ncbi:hypothetical protein ACFLU4_08560 [Chloroflexota bacterium]
MVRVRVSESLEQVSDIRGVVEVEGNTVGECLDSLAGLSPGVDKWLFREKDKFGVFIFVNGKQITPADLTSPVTGGDEFYIARVVAGG